VAYHVIGAGRTEKVSQKTAAIGIDVGGASARVALVDLRGRILFQTASPTGLGITGRRLLASLERGARAALRTAAKRDIRVAGVGVGMPAFLDESGRVAGASNLPRVNGTPVGRILEERLGLAVCVENDVSAAACGEYHFGGHRGSSRRMLLLAVGTGVGAGMIVDGRLMRLSHGCLGDPGHVIVDPSGASPCRCGGNGCLEAVASGWALMEQARRLGIKATPGQIFRRARSGDPACTRLARRAAAATGVGLASLSALLEPDTIALGGGVALEAGEPFRRLAARAWRAHAVPFLSRGARVVLARAGAEAGVLGAAALILFENQESAGPYRARA